ncbi:MAG: cob(I)yrinic acid a,c-diamide adenosyltransferase [Candidatus Omnitrophota bacterium]
MIHVYTGNGKGKTTAALGMALRAAGAGLKVYICQFAKGRSYSELRSLKKLKNIKIEQFGTTCFIRRKAGRKDIKLAQDGLRHAEKAIRGGKYDMIVLDEINIALHLGLLVKKDILGAMKAAPARIELVLTGRYAHPEVIKAADLASEIKELKHYYKKGVKARRGIEF